MPSNMSDEEVKSAPLLIGPLTRLAERVATIDGRVSSEVKSLQESVAVIRQTQHDTNGHIQNILIAEEKCASGLANVIKEMYLHKDAVNNQASQLNEKLALVASDVKSIMTHKNRIEGGWMATVKISMLLGFILSGTGAAVGAIIASAKYLGFFSALHS